MSYEKSKGMGFSPITTYLGVHVPCSDGRPGKTYCYTADAADQAHARANGCTRESGGLITGLFSGDTCRTASGNRGNIYCCNPAPGVVAGGGEAVISSTPSLAERLFCSFPPTSTMYLQCSSLRNARTAADAAAQDVASQLVDVSSQQATEAAERAYREAMNAALLSVGGVAAVGALTIGGLLWWRKRSKLRKNPRVGRRRRRGSSPARGNVRYAANKLRGEGSLTVNELMRLSWARSGGAMTKLQAKKALDTLVAEGKAEKSGNWYDYSASRRRRRRR